MKLAFKILVILAVTAVNCHYSDKYFYDRCSTSTQYLRIDVSGAQNDACQSSCPDCSFTRPLKLYNSYIHSRQKPHYHYYYNNKRCFTNVPEYSQADLSTMVPGRSLVQMNGKMFRCKNSPESSDPTKCQDSNYDPISSSQLSPSTNRPWEEITSVQPNFCPVQTKGDKCDNKDDFWKVEQGQPSTCVSSCPQCNFVSVPTGSPDCSATEPGCEWNKRCHVVRDYNLNDLASYTPGTLVQQDGRVFKCKENNPWAAWCMMMGHQPTGIYGAARVNLGETDMDQKPWLEIYGLDGTDCPQRDLGCDDLASGDSNLPADFSISSDYKAHDRVKYNGQIYKCRQYPYSQHCQTPGYEPYNPTYGHYVWLNECQNGEEAIKYWKEEAKKSEISEIQHDSYSGKSSANNQNPNQMTLQVIIIVLLSILIALVAGGLVKMTLNNRKMMKAFSAQPRSQRGSQLYEAASITTDQELQRK